MTTATTTPEGVGEALAEIVWSIVAPENSWREKLVTVCETAPFITSVTPFTDDTWAEMRPGYKRRMRELLIESGLLTADDFPKWDWAL